MQNQLIQVRPAPLMLHNDGRQLVPTHQSKCTCSRYTLHVSWLTPDYRQTAEQYAPRFVVLSGVCLLMVLTAWLGITLRGLQREQHPNALKDASEAYLRSGQYELVNWQPCRDEAFQMAIQRDRLVMIEVGAYWSGRCQRLGREAFSDSGVADLVNREFVAIKVDADAMPKLARYIRQLAQLMGAPARYPVIAWFTPDGKPVRAVAPDTRAELMRHLEELSQLYRNRPEQIEQFTSQLERAWNERWARAARIGTPEPNTPAANFLRALNDSLPPETPLTNLNHLEALLALTERGDAEAQSLLIAQLQALRQSQLWDANLGVFHALEDGIDAEGKPTGGKRLIEHARLLSLYSRASRFEPELSATAHELADALRVRFYQERPAGFINALPPPKLRIAVAQNRGLPLADPILYTDANAYAIIALCDYAEVFGKTDPQAMWARETAPRVLETLRALRTLQGDLFHSSTRQVRDWMPDLALTARAALRVHRLQPSPRARQFAYQLLEHGWRNYADPTGGFYDIARSRQWETLTIVPTRIASDDALPADNALLALATWEYAQATGDTRWQERALLLAQIIAGDYDANEPLNYTGYIMLLTTMQKTLLGRTNRYVYPVWARGNLSGAGSAEERAERLMLALLESPIETLDITPAPALWGRFLREVENTLQVAVASPVNLLLQASDARVAANLIQSHLIETLCAIGREHIDYYFLSLHESPTESQLSGALEALEIARQEGQIGATGLAAWGNPLAMLALWRSHDAFEVALLPCEADALQTLLPEARARRAGVIIPADAPDEAFQHGAQVALLSAAQAVGLTKNTKG